MHLKVFNIHDLSISIHSHSFVLSGALSFLFLSPNEKIVWCLVLTFPVIDSSRSTK